MTDFIKRVSALAAVLVVAAACDSTVQEPLAEQQQSIDGGPMLVMDLSGTFYSLPPAKAYPIGTSVSARIDQTGGSVHMGDFAGLKVPAGAVEATTIFTITVVKDGFIELDLSAHQWRNGQYMEVGALGFGVPVYLFVNSAWANLNSTSRVTTTDSGNLTMLWEINGTRFGAFQSTPSFRSGDWVISRLDHFSKYVMASN